MYNEKVERALNALIDLLPEFQERRKGDMWKAMVMTLPQVFPEDRLEVMERIRQIVLPDTGEKKPSKVEKVQAGLIGKKKRHTAKVEGEDYGCADCPKRQLPGKAIANDEVKRRKAGRAERLGVIKIVKPDRFASPEDVLERFEGNVIAMMNFCRQMNIPVGNAQKAEALAKIIFENYKG